MNIKLTDKNRLDIIDKYCAGNSSFTVAKLFNISNTTVLNVLKSNNISRHKPGNYKKYIHESRNDYYKRNNLCLWCSKLNDTLGTFCFTCLNKKYGAEATKRLGAKLRVFEKYGNKCNCCGLNDYKYFTMDHVNGGGRLHIKSIKKYLYIWLDENIKSDEFQILCWNCNCAKGFFGMCPHQLNFNRRSVNREACRKWRDNLKLKAFEIYGKSCRCCGENQFEFLSMDHINKDGSFHRKKDIQGKYGSIYQWLRDNDYPEGFQTLCYNCNAVSYKQDCNHINLIREYA